MADHGRIKIKIGEVLKDRKISKTQLTYLAFVQRGQLKKLMDGEAARVDFDVLARICNALDCKIEDILEYVPADSEEKKSQNENLEKKKCICYNANRQNEENKCPCGTKQKSQKFAPSGIFYTVWARWFNPQAGYQLLFSIQPFTDVIGDYICQDRQHN